MIIFQLLQIGRKWTGELVTFYNGLFQTSKGWLFKVCFITFELWTAWRAGWHPNSNSTLEYNVECSSFSLKERITLTVLNRSDHHHKPSEPAIMLRSLENIQYIYVIIILNLIKNVCILCKKADTQCYTWEINYNAQYRIIISLWTMNRRKQLHYYKLKSKCRRSV